MRTCERQSGGQEDLKRSLQGAGIWSDLEGGNGFGQTELGVGRRRLQWQQERGEKPAGGSER